jgi:hypothetical protein
MSNLPAAPSENRVVKVISTVSLQPKILNLPNGATWGDVLSTMSSSEIPPNYRAVVRETKQDLVEREAVLPSGEISIWLTPTHVKSGEGESPSHNYTEIRPLMNDFRESLDDSFNIVIKEVCKIIEQSSDNDIQSFEDDDGDIIVNFVAHQTRAEQSIQSLSKRLLELGLHLMFVNTRINDEIYLNELLEEIQIVEKAEDMNVSTLQMYKQQLMDNGISEAVAEEMLEAVEFFKKTGTI